MNKTEPEQAITSDPVRDAVYNAYCFTGLPREQFSDEFDLLKANKLIQVYHLSAKALDIEPELNTVGDIIKWLKS